MTYDDGPETTPELLDLLREHDVKALFFLVGKRVAARPEMVKRMEQEGHAICWHSRSHKNLWRSNPLRALLDLPLPRSNMRETIVLARAFRPRTESSQSARSWSA